MCDNDILLLHVSVGEALDKLTILDIKLDNIKDSRRDNVKVEYDMLYEKLEPYVRQSKKYYDMLKKTNFYIWNLMDLLRDGINIDDEKYLNLCKETIICNDIRFRIKNKINILSNSRLREQKGYMMLCVLIDLTDYISDIKLLMKPILYLSILYDEIHIKTNNTNILEKINEELYGIQIKTLINNYDHYKKIYIFDSKCDNETSIYNYLDITKNYIEMFI